MESRFAELVLAELQRAYAKHPKGIHSAHEGFGVIYEELNEFWDIVKADGDKQKMLLELVQTAAMCQRTAEDLCLGDLP